MLEKGGEVLQGYTIWSRILCSISLLTWGGLAFSNPHDIKEKNYEQFFVWPMKTCKVRRRIKNISCWSNDHWYQWGSLVILFSHILTTLNQSLSGIKNKAFGDLSLQQSAQCDILFYQHLLVTSSPQPVSRDGMPGSKCVLWVSDVPIPATISDQSEKNWKEGIKGRNMGAF